MSDHYLRFHLALLRNSSDAVSFFEKAARYSAVNAGIGFKRNHGEEEFLEKYKSIKAPKPSKGQHDLLAPEAVVGASLCGMNLGEKCGTAASRDYHAIENACYRSPVLSIKSEFFWGACYTIRCEAGDNRSQPDKEISWREFRILCAIYSLQWNRKNFAVAGWEIISHRASGFHRKKDFDTSATPWPDHCLPLSRRQTTDTVTRLEALGFFIRHRISAGNRGGMTAYSIRHDSREKLAKDCEEWQAFNRGDTINENRAQDQLLHAKLNEDRQKRIEKMTCEAASIQERCKSKKKVSPVEPDKYLPEDQKQAVEPPEYSKGASGVQVPCKVGARGGTSGVQGGWQHNEKSFGEKSLNEKSLNDCSAPSLLSGDGLISGEESEPTEQSETGYLVEGKFIVSADAVKIVSENPESWKLFKAATRITAPDGNIRIEETA